jgi:hypothetical protein
MRQVSMSIASRLRKLFRSDSRIAYDPTTASAVDELSDEVPTYISQAGMPIDIELTSSCLVLLDPLTLDALREGLASMPRSALTDPIAVREFITRSSTPLRVAVVHLPDVCPGRYTLDFAGVVPVNARESSSSAVDIDSGALVICDIRYLCALATSLSWQRYDQALQGPAADYSVFGAVVQEVGGPHFAIVFPDAGAEDGFCGDGTYALHVPALRQV